MANTWGNSGNSERFDFFGLQYHCRLWLQHEIKRRSYLGRKAMSNLDSILKSRDVTLLTKACLVKAMVSPVVVWMWELGYKDNWALKNWCFWTSVLEKSLESPLRTTRIFNQSILTEINPEYSLEGLMFKLKLWSFGHLMQITDSMKKTLMLGKIEDGRRG